MIVEIYGEPREEVEKVIRLKLTTRGNSVTLIAVDVQGNRVFQGDILTIDKNGVRMANDISSSIGLPLSHGQVQVLS